MRLSRIGHVAGSRGWVGALGAYKTASAADPMRPSSADAVRSSVADAICHSILAASLAAQRCDIMAQVFPSSPRY